MPRKARELKPDEVKYILSLQGKDVTQDLMKEFFADTIKSDAKFNPRDTFTLPKGKLNVKSNTRTTLGRYIFNFFVYEKIIDQMGYINKPLTEKVIEKEIIQEATTKMLENDISQENYIDFMERLNWLGYSITAFITPGFGLDAVVIPPKTEKLKKQLFKRYEKEIASGDPQIISKIEKELLESAKKELKDSGNERVLDYYESGSRGSFENNYKNTALMRGLVADPQNKGKFLISKTNLSDGIGSDETNIYGNLLLQGAGGRAIETKKGGYMAKQLTAAFQGLRIDDDGTDCGTKKTLTVKITNENKDMFKLRYYVEKGKLLLINSKNISSLVGKVIQLRSPMYCKSEYICEKCYGRLPYEIGIRDIGLTYTNIGDTLKNLSMKSFHDATVKFTDVGLDSAIIPVS